MSTPTSPTDFHHDVEAAFAARREIGPQYDEHFISALVERLMRELHDAEGRRRAAQRLILALASLLFGLPLIVFAAMGGHIFATIISFLTVLTLNVLFSWLR